MERERESEVRALPLTPPWEHAFRCPLSHHQTQAPLLFPCNAHARTHARQKGTHVEESSREREQGKSFLAKLQCRQSHAVFPIRVGPSTSNEVVCKPVTNATTQESVHSAAVTQRISKSKSRQKCTDTEFCWSTAQASPSKAGFSSAGWS